jgi:hypothetical protein
MSKPPMLTIADLVPGGIRSTDHLHIRTSDGTCSRCRVFVPEEQVPLLIWVNGKDLLIYCPACLDTPAPERESDD